MNSVRHSKLWTARRRPDRTAAAWAGCAVLTLVAVGTSLPHDPDDTGDDRVSAGRTCRSALPADEELSCGTYGFGDLRYVCPTPDAPRRCSTTTQVRVRNTGPSTAYVTVIHGPRQGERGQGPEQEIAPAHTADLCPGQGDLLFDLTLRGAGAVKSLTVVSVR
ncbi:hypothetical protein HCJ76_14070 [Streptomyces sp. MC1]|uniref:hypothetical protein n=1 Tax=Streptomyces sp. MC1 TaxID=295105 RepID=UPI0018CAE457|nr:hypothetical protein [Streptomyces sp. MC1]MBG7699175.1 hypothetical protein [Streptomyces sp. MC1]